MSTKTVILFIVVSTILTKLAKEQTDIPNENVIGNVLSSFTVVSFKSKFLKRRLLYSTNHPGSYNPTVVSNQEAHMIYGNMDGKKQQKTGATVSHDIQNELISIMANHVLKKIVEDIGSSFFSIIADEYTDINNKEQLTICVRWVDNELEEHEDFLGFYEVPNIESDTIVSSIKDAFLRLQLLLSCCRGQCYDGASNMLGRKNGVAKQIQDVEPKAHATHCHAHSLSLSVKDTTSNCKVLSDSMNNTKEIVKLVKCSPKRDKILGEIKENIEKEGASEAAGLIKLSVTRWTIRAACFQRVIDNYEALLYLWEECLSSKLEAELRGRILGCQAQMKSFDYFFGFSLGRRIYAHTDNLSKTLQNASTAKASGYIANASTAKASGSG